MSTVDMRNENRDTRLGDRIRVADHWWPRLRGMIGHPEPPDGEGLFLRPCQGVHMQWMRYPLDIVFLDHSGRVVALYPALRPWRFSRTHKEALAAVELPAGKIQKTGTEVGDKVSWQESVSAAA